MPNYDPKELTKFIFSFDFNGLYAGLQRLHLPTGSFKLLDAHACMVFAKELFEHNIDFNGNTGYWIELDHHIPDDVKRKTDELPLSLYVADKIRGSDYMRGRLNGKPYPKGAKLVATHLPIKKAAFHIK